MLQVIVEIISKLEIIGPWDLRYYVGMIYIPLMFFPIYFLCIILIKYKNGNNI